MALRPDVPYSPVQSVVPDTQQPTEYTRAEASPQDFGGQIGGALQQAGQTGERVGSAALDLATEQQGQINLSLAQNAETDYTTKLSAITDKYKSMEGLAAVGAKDQATSDIGALRQQTMASIPTIGAQRAFNQLALRHEAYAISDVGSYWSSQVKSAALNSAHALTTNAVNQGGRIEVAQDQQRFSQTLQDADAGLVQMMQQRGYGPAMQVNPQSGAVSFDESTPQGQGAKAVYTQLRDETYGAAWTNRIRALADDPSQGNAAQAQAVFDANRDQIPPEAQMKIAAYLQPKVRSFQAQTVGTDAISTADAGYRQAVTSALSTEAPGARPNPDQIANAIHLQESGGAANSATSVNGAVGGWQITPGTWSQYAKPGESINSAADNATVGKRIVADLSQKYGNDPARVAVGYFSGPGNVAPPNSPTPWIRDAVDGNGKSTSSYVSDVVSRLGGVAGVQTKADYYRTNYATILDNARTQADSQHPDDPLFAQQAVARVDQQMSAVIRQQELSYKADNDLVYQAVNGDLAKGTRPVSIDQMRATSPDVAAAWDRMQYQSPQAAHEIATRIITENAKNNGGDAHTYGAGYYNVFNAIHAPDGDPNKISDPTQLYKMVGAPGGLTMAGLEKARGEIAGKNTPDAEAESSMRAQFFRNAHGQITGSNEKLGITDPKGEDIYARFMANAYQTIDAAKASGKSPAQIFDPSSPDYVGKSIASFKRPMNVWMSDLMNSNAPVGTQPADIDPTTRDGIVAAYKSGKMSRADAAKALMNGGFATAPAASAPATPIVPAGPTVPVDE